MRSYSLVLPFLFLPLFLFSQNTESFAEKIAYAGELKPAAGIDYLLALTKDSERIAPDTLALLYHKIGVKYFQMQDYRSGIRHTLTSKKLREELLNTGTAGTNMLSQSYGNLGSLYRYLYDSEGKLTYLDSTEYFFRKVIALGDTPQNVRYVSACKETGYIFYEKSDYAKGLQFYEAGIAHLLTQDTLTLDWQSDLARLYLEKATIILAQKDSTAYAQSIENLRYAVPVLEEDGAYPILPLVYDNLADLYEKSGKNAEALRAYKQSIYWLEELIAAEYQDRTEEWKLRLAMTYNNLGDFYNGQKNYDSALAFFEKSLEIKEKLYGRGFHISKGAYHVNVGETYYEKDEFATAAQYFHTALRHFLPDFKTENLSAQPNRKQLELCAEKVNLLYALEQKGKALAALGQSDFALHTYMTADGLIDIMRKNRSDVGSDLFWREKTRGIYERALALAFAKQDHDKAFYFFEKSKAVLLLDALHAADARRFLPDSLAETESELIRKSEAARAAAATNKRKHPDYVKADAELSEFTKNLAANYPRYHAVRYDTSVPDLQANNAVYAYRNATEYVHFFYGEKHLYTLRFGNGKSKMHRVVRNAETDTLLKKHLQQFTAPSKILNDPTAFHNSAFRVYELLLRPLFPDKVFPESLVLLPDDFLNVLPFAALKIRAASSDNADYLLMQTDLRYAYSINVLQNQATPKKQSVRVFGLAPFAVQEGKRALPYSDYELKKAAENCGGKFVTGDAADKDYFLENASAFAILHLSTHAAEEGEEGNPEIAFADGNLTLDNLYSTQFDNNLIILSACETGLGDVKKGEGVLSLNRGFTYAGAKSMISSLWKINEKSTGDILGKFYENLATGDNKSLALNRAQRDFLRNADAVFQSPYYWAGLTYFGADGVVILEGKGLGKFWIFAGLGSLLLVTFFVFWRKR